ncbi:hypothetical protein DIPPA_32978 [Diplonema papillatum]|nr:hypothetical protein DIPPA_32978 [Diplonema papillatum]
MLRGEREWTIPPVTFLENGTRKGAPSVTSGEAEAGSKRLKGAAAGRWRPGRGPRAAEKVARRRDVRSLVAAATCRGLLLAQGADSPSPVLRRIAQALPAAALVEHRRSAAVRPRRLVLAGCRIAGQDAAVLQHVLESSGELFSAVDLSSAHVEVPTLQFLTRPLLAPRCGVAELAMDGVTGAFPEEEAAALRRAVTANAERQRIRTAARAAAAERKRGAKVHAAFVLCADDLAQQEVVARTHVGSLDSRARVALGECELAERLALSSTKSVPAGALRLMADERGARDEISARQAWYFGKLANSSSAAGRRLGGASVSSRSDRCFA